MDEQHSIPLPEATDILPSPPLVPSVPLLPFRPSLPSPAWALSTRLSWRIRLLLQLRT